MSELIHIASVILGVLGAALVSVGRPRLGQLVWIPANVAWIWFSLDRRDQWGAALFGVYLALAVLGARRRRWGT